MVSLSQRGDALLRVIVDHSVGSKAHAERVPAGLCDVHARDLVAVLVSADEQRGRVFGLAVPFVELDEEAGPEGFGAHHRASAPKPTAAPSLVFLKCADDVDAKAERTARPLFPLLEWGQINAA